MPGLEEHAGHGAADAAGAAADDYVLGWGLEGHGCESVFVWDWGVGFCWGSREATLWAEGAYAGAYV